jgi:hypothetical protein
MGRLRSQMMPPDVELHIREAVPSTETINVFSDFTTTDVGLFGPKQVQCTLALTNSTLWIFYWRGYVDSRRWTRIESVPLDAFGSVTTQLVSMPIRDFYQLTLRERSNTEGIRHFKNYYVTGGPFIEQLQQLLASRRAGSSSAADELGKLRALAAEGVLSAPMNGNEPRTFTWASSLMLARSQ